jgi:hypothetical protein
MDLCGLQPTREAIQSSLATINSYAASAFFVKLSLFLLYLRLFKPNKVTRWIIYGGIIVYGLFYSASIISNCALRIPQPGQPDDAATWMSRAQEYATPSQRLALVQGVFWYSKRHLQLHTHHRRALPQPRAREIPLPVAPLLLLALRLARQLEPATCLEQDLLRGQLAPGRAREFVEAGNQ